VALSDPLRVTARALTTLERGGAGGDLEGIRALVAEYEVAEIVVGHPLRLGGERGRAAAAAERFVERLRQKVTVPVRLWDERLTTRAAERAMLEMNASRRQRGAAVDRVAAALILQGYLEFDRRRREGVAGGGGGADA
jgi:putative Holliday junction resolvase